MPQPLKDNIAAWLSKNAGDLLNFFIVIMLFAVAGIHLVDDVPGGRDWGRYWHPVLEYLQLTKSYFGIVWQAGGGIVPASDPSSLVYDPFYRLLAVFFAYGVAIKVYLLTYWMASALCFSAVLARFGVMLPIRAMAVMAFTLSGTALSVITAQFIPLYFAMPAAALAFLRYCEKKNASSYLMAVLAFYMCGYTAVPNIFAVVVIGAIVSLRGSPQLVPFIKVLVGASVPLIVPYFALVCAILNSQTPEAGGQWSLWTFHPVRLLALVLPEFMQKSPYAIWYNYWYMRPGSGESYFPSIALPFMTLVGLFRNWFSIPASDGALRLCRRFFVLLLALMLCMSIGLLPAGLHYYISKIPVFWVNFPEKFFVAIIPIAIAVSAVSLHHMNRRQMLAALGAWVLLLVVCGVNNWVVSDNFRNYIRTVSWQIYLLMGAQLLFGMLAALMRNRRKFFGAFIVVSSLAFLPFPFSDAMHIFGELNDIRRMRSPLLRTFESEMRGKIVLFHPMASMNGCVARHGDDYLRFCAEYEISTYASFGMFTIGGAFSFTNFKRMGFYGFRQSVLNLKPDYVVITDADNPRRFCKDMLEGELSILGCEVLGKSHPDSELIVIKLKHANELAVHPDFTPYTIDIDVKARRDRVRVPFVLHRGWSARLDGQPTEVTRDAFGTIFDIGPPDPAKGYSEHRLTLHYNGFYTWGGALLSALWGLMAFFGYRWLRRRSSGMKAPISL